MNILSTFSTRNNELLKRCILLILLITAVLLSLRLGSAEMSISEFVDALLCRSEVGSIIIYSVRLPRIIASILAGIGLSTAGVLLQSVTDNPLASSNIIGVNAGAGFAVIVLLYFVPTSFIVLPFAAFAGAFLTTLLILTISDRIGSSKTTIILAGIAIQTVLNAGISFVSMLDTDVLASYNYFSIGGFAGAELDSMILPAIIIFASFIVSLILSSRIDLFCLGDSMASSVGVRVKMLRMICIVCASASAAAVVSFAGLLGFVGLIVPHIARKLTGSSTRKLLITSALTGSLLVVLADLVGRTLFSPTEIPVGIIMSLLGAPFFFFLLIRGRRKNDA